MSKSIIIIPSRLAATRLPNKPLIKINNKSLIMHVYEKALRSEIGDVYVATCDKEIASEVDKSGGNFILTKSKHKTGTDRVFEASQKLDLQDTDYIINLQGDEPMINPEDIKNLNNVSKKNRLDFSSLAFSIKNKDDYNDRNIVKVITKNKVTNYSISLAQNFTRKINIETNNIYHHFGVYFYRLSTLKKFVSLDQSENEKFENLEQLRALDNKIKIHIILANHYSIGIDTEQDLNNCIKLINKIT